LRQRGNALGALREPRLQRATRRERARFERRASANRARLATEARLRRQFWQTVLGTLGAGTAAAFGAWLVGPSLGRPSHTARAVSSVSNSTARTLARPCRTKLA